MNTTGNMSDGQEKVEGGVAWELSEAIRLMGEAQAAGDPEQIATAMRRHAEALTNATNALMIPTLKSVLEGVLTKQIGTLSTRLDNSDRARLERTAELQRHIDQKFDLTWGEVDRVLASQEELARGLGKLTGQVDKLLDRVDAVEETVQDHSLTLNQHGTEIKQTRADVDILQAQATRLQSQVDTLQTGLQEIRSRLAGMESDHAMFRKVLAAHPQPPELQDADAGR